MVNVATTAGLQQVDGTSFDVVDGILAVTDDSGTSLAMFAPGVWQSAVMVPAA